MKAGLVAAALAALTVAAGVAVYERAGPRADDEVGSTGDDGAAPPAVTYDIGPLEHLYVDGPDGFPIAVAMVRPVGDGPFPVLVDYSVYGPGSAVDTQYRDTFVPLGYVLVGANAPGTGCSGGVFDIFSPQEARAGAAVVEWAAAQDWSSGRVGLIGKSYPGITQWFVAKERPAGLVTIAPGHFFGDLYRDEAYPGGLPNVGFAAFWSLAAQPALSYPPALTQRMSEDPVCATNVAQRAAGVTQHPLVQLGQHQFHDELFVERSPVTYVDDVDVPVFMVHAFQDEQVGVRGVMLADRLATRGVAHQLILSNGDHEIYRSPAAQEALACWYEHWLKQPPACQPRGPPVDVWYDTTIADGARIARWSTHHASWPPADATAVRYFLSADGLGPSPPGEADADTFLYPGAPPWTGLRMVQDVPPNDPYGLGHAAPPTYLAWQTPPLENDTIIAGPVSADLYVATSGRDVDLQVTVSEVRDTGEIVHVQKGWLRAGHRDLAPESTPLRPIHNHTGRRDMPAQAPGGELRPELLRIEVPDVAHAFRAGTAIRVEVEGPTVVPEYWSFEPWPEPSTVVVAYGPEWPSSIVFPVLDGLTAGGPMPECGSVLHQPCRTEPSV